MTTTTGTGQAAPDVAAEIAPPPMVLPAADLSQAHAALSSAMRQLRSAADVQWVSDVATAYRRELDEVDQMVHAVRSRVAVAQDDWHALQSVARANGQW